MRILAMILVLMGAAMPNLAQTRQSSKNEREVWSREGQYWKYVMARDAEGYVGLWHEDFVGWPYFTEEPIRKDDIRKNPFPRNPNGALEKVELQPKSVQSLGDNVATFYVVRVTYKKNDGSTTQTVSRITHTWTKTKKGWVIISGMSAKVEGEAPGQ
jgi:ketosteroid isomerase-like protein